MTPLEQGIRAAAREADSERRNPYENGLTPADKIYAAEWQQGVDIVLEQRKNGRDPEGHQPPPPHLCVTDVTKVCNCCNKCQVQCKSEVVVASSEAKPDLLARAGWALVRIANALERGYVTPTHKTCNQCGYMLVVQGNCHICGAKP